MVAVKKREKTKVDGLSLKQVVSILSERPAFGSYLRTAVTSGWLTDGQEFLTQLTEQEIKSLKELFKKHQGSKKADLVEINLPDTVGVSVVDTKDAGDNRIALISVSGNSLTVNEAMYYTMLKRHPDAQVYFSSDNREVIFSERKPVAVLLPLSDLRRR